MLAGEQLHLFKELGLPCKEPFPNIIITVDGIDGMSDLLSFQFTQKKDENDSELVERIIDELRLRITKEMKEAREMNDLFDSI